jgi:hypothetical protein
MAWKAYRVVLRLLAPLHIGAGKVGNLQRTRPYVAGRNLWGALTARLARQSAPAAPTWADYGCMGQRLHQFLVYTYFYPTCDASGRVALWPWDDDAAFRYRFLSTYASTALDYGAVSAEDASLHEVECITPHARDTGAAVYLSGYVFEDEGLAADWLAALEHLQLGGERGYGWGRVTPVRVEEIEGEAISLFATGHRARLDGSQVRMALKPGAPLPVHALAADFDAHKALDDADVVGPVEPLVGRETRSNAGFGRTISRARICFAPGAQVARPISAYIGPYGVWEGVEHEHAPTQQSLQSN